MNGRRIITAGVVAAAIAGGGVAGAVIGVPGLSGASTSSTTAPKTSTAPAAGPHFRGFGGIGGAVDADKGVLDAAAKALKLSTKDLLTKLSDGKTTIADVAKAQNVKLQDVIDAMDAVAKQDISDFVNKPFPTFPKFGTGGPKFGTGGPKGPMGFGSGPAVGGMLGGGLDAVSKALGVTTQTLLGDLKNGQSIADIAKAKGVDVNGLITTLVNDATSKFDAAVKAKKLTQDQATKIESRLKDLITNEVNGKFGMGGGRFGFGGGHFGGRFGGPGGPAAPGARSGAAPTTSGV